MGQVLTADNIPDLVIASTTTITMASSYLGRPTRITIGGQQFKYSSLTTLNLAATGFNGLDTGTLASNQLMYIYAVQSSGTPGLVASLAAPTVGPTGFTRWKEVGRCRTFSASATLGSIVNKIGGTSQYSAKGVWETCVVTGGWTSNTTYSAKRRVDNQNMEYDITISLSGAPNAADLIIQFPSGDVIDASNQSGSVNIASILGVGRLYDTGTMSYPAAAVYRNNNEFYVSTQSGGGNVGVVNHNGPFTWGSSDTASVKLSVPLLRLNGLYT